MTFLVKFDTIQQIHGGIFMNQEKIENKLNKKYGVSSEEIKDLSIGEIKNLKNINSKVIKKIDKFKFLKKEPFKTIKQGALIGASVAGGVNTIFPDLIQSFSSLLVGRSKLNLGEQILAAAAIASKPIDILSGYAIIGIGASVGIVLNTGYKLIKNTTQALIISKDRNDARKINEEKKYIK